jgi:hypothetical protein
MAEAIAKRDITKLVWPFPDKVIQKNPSGGGSYVAHPVVEQRLIDVLGRPPHTELVEVVRGRVEGCEPNPKAKSARYQRGWAPMPDAVVGVVLRMSCMIDGERVVVEEVGDCEDPPNWPHDGARLKDAFSDAYKRCAMRLGVALHLWIKEPQKHFYLAGKLLAQDNPEAEADEPEVPDTEPIEDGPPTSPPADHEADEAPPSAASEPTPAPEGPPAPSDASTGDHGDAIDWKAFAIDAGVSPSEAILVARDVASKLGAKKPLSLKDINPAISAEVQAALVKAGQAKDEEPVPA